MTPEEVQKRQEQFREELLLPGISLKDVDLPPGWYLLLAGYIKTIKNILPDFSGDLVLQAKRKFNRTVVYMNLGYLSTKPTHLVEQVINYESLFNYVSKFTCEMCGEPTDLIYREVRRMSLPINPRYLCEGCIENHKKNPKTSSLF